MIFRFTYSGTNQAAEMEKRLVAPNCRNSMFTTKLNLTQGTYCTLCFCSCFFLVSCSTFTLQRKRQSCYCFRIFNLRIRRMTSVSVAMVTGTAQSAERGAWLPRWESERCWLMLLPLFRFILHISLTDEVAKPGKRPEELTCPAYMTDMDLWLRPHEWHLSIWEF